MARTMLKLRKGDSAIMIKADGSMEMAGVDDKPIMGENGMISPVILFAAAWARKDQRTLLTLVDNFQKAVEEGFFGADAQTDLQTLKVEWEKEKIRKNEAEKQKGISALNDSGMNPTNMEDKGPEDVLEKLNNPDGTEPEEPKEVKPIVAEGLPIPEAEPEKPVINVETTVKKKHEVDPRLQPVPVQGPDGKITMVVPNMTPEEKAKKDREDAELRRIAEAGQDPRVKRQQDAIRAGATKMTSKPFDKHMEPDLPVEQTMKYLKATPEEQKKMKAEQLKKQSEENK